MAFLVFYQAGIFNALLAAVIAFGIAFGLVALLNWILRGFIG